MKPSTGLWIAGILLLSSLGGCAVTPVEPPVTHAFSEAAPLAHADVADPLPLPDRPPAREVAAGGESYLAFAARDAAVLMELVEAGEANTVIAREHAQALRAMEQERNAIVLSGRQMEDYANHQAAQWADTETALRREQRDNTVEVTVYRALLILLGIAAL